MLMSPIQFPASVATKAPFADIARRPATVQADEPRLIDIYREAFEVTPADTPELLEQVHRLRYQIYCIENGFEKPEDNPDGLERDCFDSHSVHALLRHRPSGVYLGTVRLILPVADDPLGSFSVQHACDDPLVKDPSRFPAESAGEISRICISRDRRQQCDDPAAMRMAFLGLAQASVLLSVRHGVTHWLGLMEPCFIKRVGLLGIHFDHVGAKVEYHGIRRPISGDLTNLLSNVQQLRPDVWDVMTDEGRLWPSLDLWQLRRREWQTACVA